MGIKEDLLQIANIADKNGLSKPFIVGGLPRDKVLNRTSDIKDVDLTTGDSSIHELARLSAEFFKPTRNINYKVLSDGHSQIDMGTIKIDFSSNYISPHVKDKSSKMKEELLSRDFTCNTLIVDLNLSKIQDLTGMAIRDINNKIIKTPLDPDITLTDNTKRVVRIIYLATKLGFEVEPGIIDYIKKNPELATKDSSEKYLSDKLNESLKYDSEKTYKLINQMGLQNLVPYLGRGNV